MIERSAAVRMRGITKRFGSVHALRGADFSLARGEIHALLGENGAGKSTLMHVLFGLVAPDAGTIELDGNDVVVRSPRDAMALGFGMVHQHFTQVPRMTVAENVALALPGPWYDRAAAVAAVRGVGGATGLALDPDAPAGSLPVGLRQRLEIVKALVRDVRVLILDEPTAALTPQEVSDLSSALRRLAAAGVAVVLITHKMREVAAVADRVTVLRGGAAVLTGEAGSLTANQLACAMIGESASAHEMAEALEERGSVVVAHVPSKPALSLEGLRVRSPSGTGRLLVDGVTLDVQAGEVLGIAAVEGNGQRELLRAAAGLESCEGVVRAAGAVGFVPEDRQGEGLILEFSLAENFALGARRGVLLDRGRLASDAEAAIRTFGIQATSSSQAARTLSGGNQQKLVLARVLAGRPAVLIAENPTRGLDLHATADVHDRIRQSAREQGLGVLFFSTDLDEVLSISDRVGVMVDGRWRWVAAKERTRERVGALMLGAEA